MNNGTLRVPAAGIDRKQCQAAEHGNFTTMQAQLALYFPRTVLLPTATCFTGC
jgi:hypothetical protein